MSCIRFRERPTARDPAQPASTVVRTAALGLCGLVWLGFVCHTSPPPAVLGKYSVPYAAFLAFATAGCVTACRWIRRRRSLVPTRAFATRVGAAAVGVLALVPWAYIVAHQRSLNATVFRPLDRRAHAFFQVDDSPPLPDAAEPGARRVLCLGGSTTWRRLLRRRPLHRRGSAHRRADDLSHDAVAARAMTHERQEP